MGDTTLIGLGFQGDNNNRFQSTNPNQAPGSAAFYAAVLVQVKESLLSSPTECTYFGNYGADRGWDIGRAADQPASDPPNTPEFVTFRARLGTGGATTTLEYTCDASSIFGRTFLLTVAVVGGVATLFVNASAVASETLGGALVLGNIGLTYGNVAGGGERSGDPVISAVYTDTDAADFITNQRSLFDLIRTSGKLAASITNLGLSAAYVYESFQHKAPISGLPTTPLKNYGSAGVNGNLTFAGTAPLVTNADTDPDYTGGAQSPSSGPGAVNLQDAYDAGPTGLIATGAPGPVGVDDLRLEADTLSSVSADLNVFGLDDAAAPGRVNIQGGDATAINVNGGEINVQGGTAVGGNGNGGNVTVRGGTGAGNLSGGEVTVLGGTSFGSAAGGPAQIVGGPSSGGTGGFAILRGADGGISGTQGLDGGNATILGGAGGASASPDTGGTGGTVTLQSGAGGDATGAAATAGTPGNIIILAGAAGIVAASAAGVNGGNIAATGGAGSNAEAGDTAGNGGQIVLTTGAGGNATGALAVAGNGGELNIAAGAAGTAAGGATPGVGGALLLSAGTGGTGGGGTVNISGGNGDQFGGGVTIAAGASAGPILPVSINGGPALGVGSGPGGDVEIIGGPAAVGEPQNGGDIDITGGLAGTTGIGGVVTISGGTSAVGPGGSVLILGGAGGGGGVDNGGVGGNIEITAGAATQPANQGGSLLLVGGSASGAGAAPGGFISLDGGASTNQTGGAIFLRTGDGATDADNGFFSLGLGSAGGAGASATSGGFHLDPASNLLTLRNKDFSGTETGSLLLHRLDTAGEALQAVTTGLLHYRSEQAAGVAVTVGFRAAKSGDYGLMGRCYSRTFEAADAPGDVLVVTHNLDSEVVQYAVYDPANLKAFEAAGQIVGVQALSDDQLEISFNSGFITAGTWRVAVFGY